MDNPRPRDLNYHPLKTRDDLIAQLARHRAQIRNGTALFNGVPIDVDSELTQFVRVTGCVFFRSIEYSTYHVCEKEQLDSLRRVSIIHCLLLGWWVFPHGPIDTIWGIWTNFTGGIKVRVADVIDEDSPYPTAAVTLTTRAADAAVKFMAERGFPPGSGMRIEVTGKRRPRHYEITYDDIPMRSERDWITESNGVTIMVFKRDARKVDGLTIDFHQGAYFFDERLTSPD